MKKTFLVFSLCLVLALAGLTAAVVTLHDPVLALNRCDRLMVLKDGGVLDILCPFQDPLAKMEQVLGEVYGPVSLHLIKDRTGKTGITMLKEGES